MVCRQSFEIRTGIRSFRVGRRHGIYGLLFSEAFLARGGKLLPDSRSLNVTARPGLVINAILVLIQAYS
jgi:hypothetical protein